MPAKRRARPAAVERPHPVGRLARLLISREPPADATPLDRRTTGVLVAATLLLIVFQYFGKPEAARGTALGAALEPLAVAWFGAHAAIAPFAWWAFTSLVLRVAVPLGLVVFVFRERPADYAPAQSAIALVYDRMAMPDKAEQHYLKAIDLDPKNGSVYNNYGVFLCRVNRLKEADTYFMKAIQTPRYPTPERAYENAGACARRIPDLDKAEAYLRKALSRNARLPVALYNMAEISFARERFLSTRAYLERFAEVAKPTPESLWLGVRAERKLGNKQGAQQYAKLLQTNYPDSLQFKWLLDSEEGDHKP